MTEFDLFLGEVKKTISSHGLPINDAHALKDEFVKPSVTLEKYLELSVKYGTITLIDGAYYFTLTSKRTPDEITRRLKNLFDRKNELTGTDDYEEAKELAGIDGWISAIEWLCKPCEPKKK